jgi:uncharacterized protein YbjT (DUF2867 family)
VRLLVEQGVPVRAVTRDPARATKMPELAGAEIFAGDSSVPETLSGAFDGVDKVYLVPPTVPQWDQLQTQLIELARHNNVQHIVRISSVGTAPDAVSMTLRSHWKGEREMERSGMAFTHIRSNSFYQNCLFDVSSIKGEDRFFSCVGRVRYAKVDTRDIARVVVLALTEPGHENQAYTLTGPEALTYREMATKLTRALGREIAYVDLPNEQYEEYLRSTGLPSWLAEEFVAMYGFYEEGSFVEETTDTIQRLLGRPPGSFDKFAEDYKAHF